MKKVTVSEFLNLRNSIPLLDVRSQKEYACGHIQGAINIPLLHDEDRDQVGKIYKEKGQKQALYTGLERVGHRLHQMVKKADQLANNRKLLLYCWRGGLRSENFARFVEIVGIQPFILDQGYKQYRRYGLELFSNPWKIIRLSGGTGSGKTEIIRTLAAKGEQSVDLEGIASHRGSAFGSLLMPSQPSTEQFQNTLFEQLRQFDPNRRVWIEDESIAIGNIFLPEAFWAQMKRSPVIQLDIDKKQRVDRLVEEYARAPTDLFLESMQKIVKKWGEKNYDIAKKYWLGGDKRNCIQTLLSYYDTAYLKSRKKKKEKIITFLSGTGKTTDDIAQQLIYETPECEYRNSR